MCHSLRNLRILEDPSSDRLLAVCFSLLMSEICRACRATVAKELRARLVIGSLLV